jgi:hypothetical protein
MPSSLNGRFCKTSRCPTSDALLAYHRLNLATQDQVSIETHLTSCDFCGAELQLLNRYCGDAEEYLFVEMPSQLRRLAEDLLKNSAGTIRGSLNSARDASCRIESHFGSPGMDASSLTGSI